MSIFGRYRDSGPVLREQKAEMHWDTEDPFIFASHHHDDYPKGNRQQAPPLEEIKRRQLGNDYSPMYGYRMYQGKVAPGFPAHPHWGYETVTICTEGYVDHYDSLGNQGRFGYGDVQWLTAGSLYAHDEMYPLAFADRGNPHSVTQIMINLPLAKKNTPVELNNVWAEDVPVEEDEGWKAWLYAGTFAGKTAVVPNKTSWAADPSHHVRIVRFTLEPGAEITLEAIGKQTGRNIYCEGPVSVGEKKFIPLTRLKLKPDTECTVKNGDKANEVWLLEGDPINEKQSSWGPVVLGTDAEVRHANNVVRKTMIDDWPWDFINKTQPVATDRFIRYADGTEKRPKQKDPRELPPARPFTEEDIAKEKAVDAKQKEKEKIADRWNEED
jgi:redox-sensitive bicupin YhaK (pirin superfamily)